MTMYRYCTMTSSLISSWQQTQVHLTANTKLNCLEPISQGRQYHFSHSEKAQYLSKYLHIAPEGGTRCNIYAIGVLFSKLVDYDCFFLFPVASRMNLYCYVLSVKLTIIALTLLQSNVWKQLKTWCNLRGYSTNVIIHACTY